MARAAKAGTRPVSGILLLDKATGLTSNRALQQVKRLFRAQKAGHTGTLDPLATGMLPICLGAATRITGLMLASSKRYRVTAEFGSSTDTGDAAGSVVERRPQGELPLATVATVLSRFEGRVLQTPPMYSALKHEGRRLYDLARKGEHVERPPRPIDIFEIRIEALAWPLLTLYVHCSKGTYIRSLVADVAAELGALAHVQSLRRVGVGPFAEGQMSTMETLEAVGGEGLEALDRRLLPIDAALRDRPMVSVSSADALALRQGRRIAVDAPEGGPSIRVYDPTGALVGLAESSGPGELKPSCIFSVSALG
jgi:tRNA pseudouridine55 synthase